MKSKKKIVEQYLKAHSISPVGHLAQDLTENNWRALRFPAYAISNLTYLQNLTEIISELATVEIKNNETQSRYYNFLTQLFGVWFVSNTLGLRVKQIESHSSKIFSPHSSGKKSCDIMGQNGGSSIYFEVKELSSETLSRHPDEKFPDLIHLTPRTPRQKNIWIKKQINSAIRKGANFLICHIPVWGAYGKPALGTRWLKQIFPLINKLGCKEFEIDTNRNYPIFFQGVYLVKNRRHLLLRFQNTDI